MRRELCIVALLCIAGCESKPNEAAVTPLPSPTPLVELDDATTARALVFAPAIPPIDGELDLDREARQATAFLGYEDLVKEYIYVRTDDRWSGDGKGDDYQRRATIERIGTLTR